MSFNMKTILFWGSIMFDNCVAFCQCHDKVGNVLSYTLPDFK